MRTAISPNRLVPRSEEHTSELQSPDHLVCRLLLEKKNSGIKTIPIGAIALRSGVNCRGLLTVWLDCSALMALSFSPLISLSLVSSFFFFNDTATTEIYTLSLHDALPISSQATLHKVKERKNLQFSLHIFSRSEEHTSELQSPDHLVCRLLLEKKKKE